MVMCYTMYIRLREGDWMSKNVEPKFIIQYDTVTARIEQETVISFDKDTDTWHLYTSVPSHARKWEDAVVPSKDYISMKVYRKSPKELIGLAGVINGSASIRKKRNYTEEELESMKERMSKNIHNKSDE